MAVLTREEFFNRVNDRIGTDASDDAISFVEDMTDTFNDLERRATEGGAEDWERRYNELDASWRERYRKRFFSGDNRFMQDVTDTEETEEYAPEEVTVDDLFEEEERR